MLLISWAQYRPMHVSFPPAWQAVAAWLFFFTPSLLPGVSGWSVWHLVLSALCFWPLLRLRALQPLVLALWRKT